MNQAVKDLIAEINAILVTGYQLNPSNDKDKAAQDALDLLASLAQQAPEFLLERIIAVVEVKIDGMIMVALAVLAGQAPAEFLSNSKINAKISEVLGFYNPADLIDFVELVKSKSFGRGLGSRPQKWIRNVLEGLKIVEIESIIASEESTSFYDLIRLVHPRYQGARGRLVKDFLSQNRMEQAH